MPRPVREAGLLLHPTSLPSRFGIGDLGPASDVFLDWAASAGLRLWQILPLVPSGAHDSPYAGLSAFAGNPLLVSPEWLLEEGLLPSSALEGAP
jgi:4-alpha-glucanotransferase